MAQLVGGHAFGQRGVAAAGEQLVGGGDDGPDGAFARVVLVAARAGWDHQVVGLGGGRGVPVARELVAQRRQDVDEPDAGLGLGVANGDAAVREVDVAPPQRGRLPDPQPGVDERGDEGAAAGGPGLGFGVELGGGVDHGGDLLGRVEEDRAPALGLEFAVAGVDADGVARDEVALLGDGEDLTQPRDRLVDRLGAEDALAYLEVAVAVDFGDGDLRQPMLVEERQQVVAELPGVVGDRGGSQLGTVYCRRMPPLWGLAA